LAAVRQHRSCFKRAAGCSANVLQPESYFYASLRTENSTGGAFRAGTAGRGATPEHRILGQQQFRSREVTIIKKIAARFHPQLEKKWKAGRRKEEVPG
jgi:hypothetical protein